MWGVMLGNELAALGTPHHSFLPYHHRLHMAPYTLGIAGLTDARALLPPCPIPCSRNTTPCAPWYIADRDIHHQSYACRSIVFAFQVLQDAQHAMRLVSSFVPPDRLGMV